MNKIIYFILFVGFVISNPLLAQDEDFGEARLFYRAETYGGYIQHTNGWGLGIRKANRIDGFNKMVFSCDLVTMKHNKEIKQMASSFGVVKRYAYGKLNSFIMLRPAIGKQKIIFTKDVRKGVEISVNYSVGASLGYAKPVYLKIETPDVFSTIKEESIERYDPLKHYPNSIAGNAGFSRGLTEGNFYPGLYGKFGLGFEYASKDDLIRYVETGLTFDGHYREVPIMAFADNQQFFITFYLNFFLGKKTI